MSLIPLQRHHVKMFKFNLFDKCDHMNFYTPYLECIRPVLKPSHILNCTECTNAVYLWHIFRRLLCAACRDKVDLSATLINHFSVMTRLLKQKLEHRFEICFTCSFHFIKKKNFWVMRVFVQTGAGGVHIFVQMRGTSLQDLDFWTISFWRHHGGFKNSKQKKNHMK